MDLDLFLQTVYALIRDHVPPDSNGLPAAAVGTLVRVRSGLDWAQHGYTKLSDVLAELERRKLIRVGLNSKNALSVWLASDAPLNPEMRHLGQENGSTSPGPTPSVPPLRQTNRRLRAPMWYAVVSSDPPNRRLLNRQTGEVWLLPDSPPGASLRDWVQIDAISEEEQRGWARGFVAEHPSFANSNSEHILRCIGSDAWFRIFPDALKEKGPHLVAAWNRIRTQRVLLHVENWRERNQVPPELIYDDSTEARVQLTPRQSNRERTGLRALLIDAIGRASLAELLELRIPARYLIEALRPELLADRNREQ